MAHQRLKIIASISDRRDDCIRVRCRCRRRLRWHAPEYREVLRNAGARTGNGVGPHCVAPDGGAPNIGIERIIDRGRRVGHFADRDSRARSGAGVETDVVGRRIRALRGDRAGLVDVRGENALAAEVQRRGTVDYARGRYRQLYCERGRRRRAISGTAGECEASRKGESEFPSHLNFSSKNGMRRTQLKQLVAATDRLQRSSFEYFLMEMWLILA